jgi:hypothetical protein
MMIGAEVAAVLIKWPSSATTKNSFFGEGMQAKASWWAATAAKISSVVRMVSFLRMVVIASVSVGVRRRSRRQGKIAA